METTDELGLINLDEYKVNVGIAVEFTQTGAVEPLPESIGAFKAIVTTFDGGRQVSGYLPMVPCQDIFESTQELDKLKAEFIKEGS